MNQPRNKRSPAELFAGFDTTLQHYLYDRPRAYYRMVRHKLENLPQTNYDLGCEFASRGQWLDASFRFRFALYLEPKMVQAHYNLGCCYLRLGKHEKARASFQRALQLNPAHQESQFMLSGMEPGRTGAIHAPTRMPAETIIAFFTEIAPEYDQLAESNQYQGARLVAEACRPFLTQTTDLHFVEFGSGTGLVARPWRGLCREVLGVDFTPAMVTASEVARAGDNPVYDRVLNADVNRIEPGTFMPSATDVVVCCDVAQFLGELGAVTKTAAGMLKPGGLFVLTVEPHTVASGYGVNIDTGRFGHSVEYVKQVATAHGLLLKRDARVPLYATLPAHLFVFAKAAP